ncbi:MAG: MarR family transcriptional regulator [Candidatus Dormibacteraeota bacterium]|nr:MarR family transcriptional regulator [Candidatus Dormibacteraeota bacterium]
MTSIVVAAARSAVESETSAALVERLLAIVPRLGASINADVRQQKLSVPLTMGQFRTLRHLAAGYCTSADLARHLVVTPSTITRLVDGLQRKGLVQRVSSATDRREVGLELTDAGRAILREFQRKASKRVHILVDQLTAAEQRLLERSLADLDRALLKSALGQR